MSPHLHILILCVLGRAHFTSRVFSEMNNLEFISFCGLPTGKGSFPLSPAGGFSEEGSNSTSDFLLFPLPLALF